jgi:hypothetical protein
MKVKVEKVQWKNWRNENSGEGGQAYAGKTAETITLNGRIYPRGTRVMLGANGYKLVAIEGGFRSVPCRAATTSDATVEVFEANGCLVARTT